MKVKVLLPFNDKYNLARTFNPGEIVDFEDGRAKNIVERGLGVAFTEAEEEVDNVVTNEPSAEAEVSEHEAEVSGDITEEVEKKKPGRRKKKEE